MLPFQHISLVSIQAIEPMSVVGILGTLLTTICVTDDHIYERTTLFSCIKKMYIYRSVESGRSFLTFHKHQY